MTQKDEEELFVQRDSWKHEWEIILGLYMNRYIITSEYDMLGFKEHDNMENWNSNFVDMDTSNHVVKIISENKQLNANIHDNCTHKYSMKS